MHVRIMEFQSFQVFASTAFVLVFLVLVFELHKALVVKPRRLRSAMRKQGIIGPPPTFLLGNLLEMRRAVKVNNIAPDHHHHDLPESSNYFTKMVNNYHNCGDFLFSLLDKWRKQYGEMFLLSLGHIQILHVNQYDVVREITTCTSLDWGRPRFVAKEFHPLFGDGILSSNGKYWLQQKKILAPELYMEKVKGMLSVIHESTLMLMNSWKDLTEVHGGIADIKIDPYIRKFSGEIISRACFGSSYDEGEQLFHKLRALEKNISDKFLSLGVPGLRYVPTKNNREAWSLQKEIRTLILNLVHKKNVESKSADHRNLLQTVLEAANKNNNLSSDAVESFVIDNCKNIYLAGYETTAVAASWCLMLLASNKEWQERVRSEVLEICKGKVPGYDSLAKMKQLTMVINESLRLYPPVSIMSREALQDMKLGNIQIPKRTILWILTTTLHTDPDIWGPDSYQFNPERFSNGITGACKLPYLYMPFGVGSRMCLGMNLAMVELKILLSMVLSNFSFSISPKYVHAPALHMVTEPEYGVDLVIEKLN